MKKKLKRWLSAAAALVLTAGILAFGGGETASAAESAAGDTVEVTMSFDCSSIGTEEALKELGFDSSMPDITVEIPKNGTVYDAILKAEAEHEDDIKADRTSRYIYRAYGLGNALEGVGELLGFESVPTSPYNYTWAGWIYSVDGKTAGVGAADYKLYQDTEVNFRYQLAYKEGGAYDWDFIDAYNDVKENIEKAESLDTKDFTEAQREALDKSLADAKKTKSQIDDESGGLWAVYFQNKDTALWGPGSPTEELQKADKSLSSAINGDIAPESIEVEDIGNVYVGKKTRINYNVMPEGASQEVTYEVIPISAGEIEAGDGYVTGKKEGIAFLQIYSKENPDVYTPLIRVYVKKLPLNIEKADKIFEETASYISSVLEPEYDDWMVMGLARSGKLTDGQKKEYYSRVVNYLDSEERLYATDYARTIIGLTSAGWDVTDVNGENLLERLSDFRFATQSGINAAAYTLIAYDSHDYDIPELENGDTDKRSSGKTTRQALVSYLLDAEVTDEDGNKSGGWNYDTASKEADVDMSAMVLQALAPYCGSSEVKAACDRTVERLSGMQKDSGAFESWGSENASSTAEVIVALTAIDVDVDSDERFIKNGNTVIDGMNSLSAEGGGYRYGDEITPNSYATKQGYYGMTAYYRFLSGENSLYDMTDVKISENPQPEDGSNGSGAGDGSVSEDSGNDFNNSNTYVTNGAGNDDKGTGADTGDSFNMAVIAAAALLALITAMGAVSRKGDRRSL